MEMGTWQKTQLEGSCSMQSARKKFIGKSYSMRNTSSSWMHLGSYMKKMSGWEEEREAERREHARQLEESEKRRQADLQQFRQEFLSMLQASNGQSQVPQVLVKLFA
jgi:hypothetical protein